MDTVLNMSWLNILGFTLLAIGVAGSLFSSYRYLIAYLVAGMLYWLGIEGGSFILQAAFDFSTFNAYISAIGLSMVAIFAWLAITEPKRQLKREALREATYIAHTPLYDGEVPTSKGYGNKGFMFRSFKPKKSS